jgi:pentatricopeptide repeat protein
MKPAAVTKKGQTTVIPHMAAVGALVGALARANELDQALQLYKQVFSNMS